MLCDKYMNTVMHNSKTFRSLVQWVIVAFFYLLSTSLLFADVSYKPKSGKIWPIITLSGTITTDDLKHFITFSQMARKEGMPYTVVLNSLGGDVETAISMGRIVRQEDVIVGVYGNDKCVSSCVFVLAGGKSRIVNGRARVGIHRPFSPIDMQTTTLQQRQKYERLEKEVKSYLREMNIPTELYDHMVRIPPEKVKYLSEAELQRYGLNENDPYDDAAQTASLAKRLGISNQEMIRRKAKWDKECSTTSASNLEECSRRVIDEGR